jgi:hypothetical protein
VSGLQFIAAIVNSLAWPAAVVAAAVLLRKELRDAFRRMELLKFPGGEARFAVLAPYERTFAVAALAVAAQDAGSPADMTQVSREETEFGALEAQAQSAPGQAIIDAWGLLEYQLNTASDRVAPGQPHGWPQVAQGLESLDQWPVLSPAIGELRRLRDYTVESSWPPSAADAVRYVSLAQDLVTTLRAAVTVQYGDGVGTGGGR